MEPNAPAPLKALKDMILAGPAGPGAPALLPALEAAGLLEQALSLLRLEDADRSWEPFRAQLKTAVAHSRDRRMHSWQADPHRRTLRFLFEAAGPACSQHPPALAASLARAFLDAGLPLAMGLEKLPRPAVHLGHPLPLDVPGRGEWADASFTQAPKEPLAELPAQLNAHAAEGLTFLRCEGVPNYATPVAELCRAALWRWRCPGDLLATARAKVDVFLDAATFDMEKSGKTGGHKGVKRVEIRGLVERMAWDGPVLDFATRIAPGQAPNARKLLGAILGLDPSAIPDLERLSLELGEDPRLLEADRYEPKLHNMYEDAVLLDSGPHIRIVDDDDDDPIVLRG